MKNSYKRMEEIKYWLVKKEDLREIYNFIKARMEIIKGEEVDIEIDIILEFESGDSVKYNSFDEFEVNIEKLENLLQKGEITKTLTISSSTDINIHKSIHIWLSLEFGKFGFGRFNIIGKDSDGSLRDFVLGCMDGVKKIFFSFGIDDKIIQLLAGRFPRVKEMFVEFDIFSKLSNSLTEELNSLEKNKPDHIMSVKIVSDQNILSKGQKFSRFIREHWSVMLILLIATLITTVIAVLEYFGKPSP